MSIFVKYLYINIEKTKKENTIMARNFVIVVDSCSDLSAEIRKELGIEYVRMGVVKNVGKENEEEVFASLDWEIYSNKELNYICFNFIPGTKYSSSKIRKSIPLGKKKRKQSLIFSPVLTLSH